MKVLILPSVLGQTWSHDFETLGLPKQILYQTKYENTKDEYTNHIGLYDLTIEEFAKLANSNNKETNLKTHGDFEGSEITEK